MHKKSTLIGLLGLLCFLGASLHAQPIARYTFDNGIAWDNSGNGFDGVPLGDAEIVADPGRGQV